MCNENTSDFLDMSSSVSLIWDTSPLPLSLSIPDWLPAFVLFWYIIEFFSCKLKNTFYMSGESDQNY